MEITTEKLYDLITTGESETVEFKESFGDEAIETIRAFANARGGILLISNILQKNTYKKWNYLNAKLKL